MPVNTEVPGKVRVSLGTAIVLGLLDGKVDAEPTTAYLMTYKDGKCLANCVFCPQARESRSRADMLSRVSWPVFDTGKVIGKIKEVSEKGKIRRVCLQALNYPEVFNHLNAILAKLLPQVKTPVSVSCQPLGFENLRSLADIGVERIGIPIDAATEKIFDKVKGATAGGPYNIKRQWNMLEEALTFFGKGKVTTHFIVGLGETEKEMVLVIQKCVDMGVLPALFAFTPVSGTLLENQKQPPIQQYRRMQMARYLIFHGISRSEFMSFDGNDRLIDFGVEEKILKKALASGTPFLTSGCPYCNRPYYNEKPSGPIYNYPKPLNRKEVMQVAEELGALSKLYSVGHG